MSISPPADFLRKLYQSWSERMVANPALTIADLRSLFDEWHQPTMEPEGVTYKSTVNTVSLKVPVGPDRRTPLRDVALLEKLHALMTSVVDERTPVSPSLASSGGPLTGA